MDPKKAECKGLYLYGAGWFAQDDNTLGLVTGQGSSQPHFCLTCPLLTPCQNEHEQRVRRLQPAAAEQFDRQMRKAVKRGMGPTLAAVWLGKNGRDPFMSAAVENFGQGHADRGRKDGALVQ